ncbi:hypothetical protein QMG90_01940 [Trabulsiella odontotermitis]|uniref:hypothetical protein n=1 Tax=Trabulsiella odontotermitis TaxID=379893 RepID=UPI0024B7B264|nr:hypothetical protein [Trabulsiella odontotermitis]WHP31734.1 hypothetical protein QMG90_01940 [Trabulsiella odontotermitis]
MIRRIEDLDFEDEFRRMNCLLSASAELHGSDQAENDLSFELLDKVLYRVREINQTFEKERGEENV